MKVGMSNMKRKTRVRNKNVGSGKTEPTLVSKINKVIRAMNVAYRQEDIQLFLANCDTVLSEDPYKSIIDLDAKSLFRFSAISDTDAIIYAIDYIIVSVKETNILTKNSSTKITKEQMSCFHFESYLLDLPSKTITDIFRQRIISENKKDIDRIKGRINRQLTLIEKLESFVSF